MNCRLHVFPPFSPLPPVSLLRINKNSHTRNTVQYAARSSYPDWSATQINRDQTALVALDKFHANGRRRRRGRGKKNRQNNEKRYKSSVALSVKCAHADGSDAQTERLSSPLALNILSFSLSFAPKRQLYSNKSNCKMWQLLRAKTHAACSARFVCRARLGCYWINARSFQRPSDSPVN